MFFLVEVSLIDNVCRFFKDVFKRTSNFCKNHTEWNFCMRNTLCILIKIKLSHSSHFLRFAEYCGHRKPQIADFADLRNSAKNENPVLILKETTRKFPNKIGSLIICNHIQKA
jgi:hypothetical protein